MTEQSESAAGMLQTIIESFRSHVNERVNSPFAGAFLIAWVMINWKAILVVALSKRPIEDRLDYVSTTYFDASSVLIRPLIYALLGVVAYYLAATLFLGLFEVYGFLRREVEQIFDRIRWVDPSTYIRFKSESRDKIKDLTEMAADNQEKIILLEKALSERESKINALSSDLERSELFLQGQQDRVREASREIADLNQKCSHYSRMLASQKIRNGEVASDLRMLNIVILNLSKQLFADSKYGLNDGIANKLQHDGVLRRPGRQEFDPDVARSRMQSIASELEALAARHRDVIGAIDDDMPFGNEGGSDLTVADEKEQV